MLQMIFTLRVMITLIMIKVTLKIGMKLKSVTTVMMMMKII